MKIAVSQLNYHTGNFAENITKIKHSITKAKKENSDLIVFAEMAICGYPPRDFLQYNDFVEKCQHSILEIAAECKDIAVIIGSPSFNKTKKGKKLYNSAFFIENGKIKAIVNKTLLPTYDIFDEYRYFEPNDVFNIIEYKGEKIALTICEDLWNVDKHPLYKVTPMDELVKLSPTLLINIAASPYNYEQNKIRKEILCNNAKEYKLPLVYVNHVGAQSELIFDGGSMVIDNKGNIINELKYFEEDFLIIDTAKPAIDVNKKKYSQIESIHNALVLGIKDYFGKLGFNKAILGLSGGIDSAVTIVLAVKALGKENVLPVLLPSRYSSDHSVNDAVKLAENLGCKYEVINIEEAFNGFENTLKPLFADRPTDLTEENIQARVRAVILMALTNKFGYILLNTSNKSEAAVGYGTLYGDMCGGISVIGDLYKTQVYELARLINKEKHIIPKNTIIKPPSAELRPEQKDSDSLPEYEILDKNLYQYIEMSKSPDDIIAMGFDKEIVYKSCRLVNISEYKRHQSPPILRVSPKAFGMGRRMPIVGKYLL